MTWCSAHDLGAGVPGEYRRAQRAARRGDGQSGDDSRSPHWHPTHPGMRTPSIECLQPDDETGQNDRRCPRQLAVASTVAESTDLSRLL
jgi:hypothetical protein